MNVPFSTISKNVLSLGFSGVVSMLVSAATDIAIARHLGVERFGQYSTALAFSTVFIVLSDFGMTFNLVRVGSRDPAALDVTLGNTLAAKTVLAVAAYALMIAIALWAGYPPATREMIFILGIATLLFNLHPTFSGVFEVHQRMELSAFCRTLSFVLIALASLPGLLLGAGMTYFAAANLAATAAATVVWYRMSSRYARPVLDVGRIGPMFRESIPFGLGGIFYMSYFRMDTVILSLFRSEREVGIYSAAYKLFEIVVKVAATVSTAVLPVMYRHSVADLGKLRTLYHRLVAISAALAVGGAVVIYALAPVVLQVLYGDRFADSTIVLQVLAFAILFRLIGASPGDVLFSVDRVAWKTAAQGATGLATIAADVVLISLYGTVGAALATVLSEFLLFALCAALASVALSRARNASASSP